jgi:exoribonuclease-2
MNGKNERMDRFLLGNIAHRAMISHGFLPDFSAEVLTELAKISSPAIAAGDEPLVDLRKVLWCSLDNDDSRDLDQLTAVGPSDHDTVKILIAIADVDATVKKQTCIDMHAQRNTTSVYTIPEVFPMLPERLSTDITSLNLACDRLAIVIELTIAADGSVVNSKLYRATVRNKARLSYNSVAAWLEGTSPIPSELVSVEGMENSLRLQDSVAQKMRALRHTHGALVFESIAAKPVFSGETLMNLIPDTENRAKKIIEDFMIAANGATARYLEEKNFASIRRMVRTPKRWDRIVSIAAGHGTALPEKPDAVALEGFLVSSQKADPLRFPDLSLSIIKLLGSGEYIVQMPGTSGEGHFGLAVRDYTHSTAPNRRYPDLITQRLIKAALMEVPSPYSLAELESLALHCTQAEDAAKKVERQIVKSAAAILLESRTGEQFDAIITGASEKGTWVRIMDPPLEGKLESGFEGLDVGHSLRVQLVSTNVERGYIDFKAIR